MEYNLARGVELYKMVFDNPNIRRSLNKLVETIINMIGTERFDPRSVNLDVMSPAGSPSTILILLRSAEYCTAPIVEGYRPDTKDSSHQLIRYVDSLYKALMGGNPALAGWFHTCPALCSTIFSVAHYILVHRYQYDRIDLNIPMDWDIFDHYHSHDLIIKSDIVG